LELYDDLCKERYITGRNSDIYSFGVNRSKFYSLVNAARDAKEKNGDKISKKKAKSLGPFASRKQIGK
jgi:hypothetical protein